MKKIAIGLSLAALAITGTAMAAQDAGPGRGNDRTTSRAEALTRSEQRFARMDVNSDGKLDTADREARRTAMFDRMDGNKDGQISRAEFSAARPAMGRGGDRHGMSGDDKGPGQMRGHGGRGHRMGGMMPMRLADSNNDGAVTKAEFTTAAATRFDRADSNRDGQLTPAERQAARTAMRERMRDMKEAGAPTAPPTAN